MSANKTPLVGLSQSELVGELQKHGLEPLRARQVWHWVFNRGTTVSSRCQPSPGMSRLAGRALHARPTRHPPRTDVARRHAEVAAGLGRRQPRRNRLYPRRRTRGSVHIFSSRLHADVFLLPYRNAAFGPQLAGWRNGGSGAHRTRSARGMGPKRTDCLFTSIVFMGMGEPLFNLDNVARSIAIFKDQEGIAISRRESRSPRPAWPRVISAGRACGKPRHFAACRAGRPQTSLCRWNRKFPLADLLEAFRAYPAANNSRHILFEYVMLKEVNDSDADARELVRLLAGIHAKVNLIPFNPWPGAGFACSTAEHSRHLPASSTTPATPRRCRHAPRGRDILAACGHSGPRASAKLCCSAKVLKGGRARHEP